MNGRRPFLLPALVAFCLGAGLMLPFEYTITRLLGVISFGAFLVLGLMAVASPGFLESDGLED